jgi:serine/threonine-protein kinase
MQCPQLQIGIEVGDTLLGKYRVERVLGVGGMGAVVAAYHLRLDRTVAIKVLLPEVLEDGDMVPRFEREARAAAKIK